MEPAAVLGLALVGLLGLLAGTVVDSVVGRVLAGAAVGPALRPQCPCGTYRQGSDALPLVWLTRTDRRCPGCGASSGRRRLTLELGCAVAFLALALVLELTWQLPAYLYLAALCLALTVIDLATQRLPNALTIPAYPVFGGLLLVPAIVEGLWESYARAAVGGLGLLAAYLMLALVNPAGMGLGDVKLSGVLGMALGWLGWASWIVGAVGAFLLAAVVGLALLVTRRAHRSTLIPFGPFMVAGAFLGILAVPIVAGLVLASGALG